MGGQRECWVTTALDSSQSVKALVLAKSLKRVMTSRSIIVLVSHLVSEELCELLQEEFDICIRLDRRWTKISGMTVDFYSKLFTWSLVKWNKIAFVHPDCMVVRHCDEIFQQNGFSTIGNDNSAVFVAKPSLDIWRKITETARNTKNFDEAKLFEHVFGNNSKSLEEKFNLALDLKNGFLAKNLDEILIVRFTGSHPMEILSKNETELIPGIMESAIMDIWKNHFDHGIAQALSKVENIQFNGLKGYLDQYQNVQLEKQINLNELKDAIAIVGMSCRFPGANNLEEFWKLLIEGGDAIRAAPEGRWNLNRCPELPDDSKNSRAGFLNCPVDEFDGKFFGVSPMELSFMDPQQRLTLQLAWEALEDAGIDPLSLPNSYAGVFGGAWRTDYREALQNTGLSESEFFRSYLGNSFGCITARISHFLGLTGPSVTTESGCSSSIVAVDLACKSLIRGETDLSLACGVNLLIHPFTGRTMNTVLAPDGHCKTFDANADGFGRAEGCAVLVLKRYADAVKDGDRVWALIRGSAVVQEGASRSLGTPTKFCEALAMKMALDEAGVEPKDVSYVETHGTGTPVGDPLEVAAVAEVYSAGRTKEDPLTIGSVKTNIGHTESCSGIAGIIKVALSMQYEMIPPHKNFTTLNPMIDLDCIPAQIPLEALEWKRNPNGKPRIAGVSSFGITGTDAHAIIQETPEIKHPKLTGHKDNKEEERPYHILTLAGKNEEALDQSLKKFKQYLENTSERLQDVAYTANVGRGHFSHRAAIVGKNHVDLLEQMKNTTIRKQAPEEPPKLCFLFTGQGSQYPGMAKSLYDHNLTFRLHFEQCDKVLSNSYGISIKEALWGGNSVNLSRTIYSQTSIFCIEYCLLKLWESWGVKPDYVLGHSLGEFAAAVGAGILKFEDALKLVAERSRLIDGLPGGKMLVLKENNDIVEILMKKAFEGTDKWLDFAAVNSAEQTVVAGSEENVQAFVEFCKNNQIKTHILQATHAFHSRHMDPILNEYRGIANTVEYYKPTAVYVSGMEGRIIEEPNYVNAEYWVKHTRDSVRFTSASKAIMQQECTLFLEVGPQPVLSALTMINSDGLNTELITCLPSIRKHEEDWPTILTTLGKLYVNGVNVDWKRFDQFSSTKKLTLPVYPFQNKQYWFDIPDKGPGRIHPLVGSAVSNASHLKLYQHKLELETVQFLKDHAIGNKIIFPGAGFMEMCLVSGHAATQCTETGYFAPTAPITLEHFQIESPLGLAENEATQLQVIVSSEDSGDTRVTVYSKLVLDKETQKWVRHASAVFSPYAVQTKEEGELNEFDTLEAIRSRCSENISIGETYGKLSDFGLKFGPTFQTLTEMWKATDASEMCFEVKVTDDPEKYICHPVVVDAMIQAVMICSNPEANKLHVPVSVTKFVWFAKIETENCYIHCRITPSDITATLYDSNGTALAQMFGAVLMETTVGAIMSALEAQKLSLPAMYEDVWRTQTGPMERRVNLLQVFNQSNFEDEYVAKMIQKHNPLSEFEEGFEATIFKLYGYYIIKALHDLGFNGRVGIPYNIKELVSSLQVQPSLEGFLRYVFIELSEDGYFEIVNEERESMTFRMIKNLPPLEEVKEQIEILYNIAHPLSPNEVTYCTATGMRIAAIVKGEESALPYIFPEDSNEASAETYYMESKICVHGHKMVIDFMNQWFSKTAKILEETKGLLRILEVGAGTGSFTKDLLLHLNGPASGYEYTYTDISPVFFLSGQKVFENSKIKVLYRLLNIDEDPASQGFVPKHYDLIIANNVIHVTKDVTETCRNLRNLLRDDGAIFISESLEPVRGTKITFGLLDAYWNFQDYDIRNYNCEISAEQWVSVLENTGFGKTSALKSYNGAAGFIVGQADRSSSYRPFSGVIPLKKTRTWLLFSEDGPTSTFFHEKLLELGNQVVVIKRATEYKQTDVFTYNINGHDEDHMQTLFQSVMKECKLAVDGAIYLWGLNYAETNVDSVVEPYLYLCKSMIVIDQPKLFVITRGITSIADQEVILPSASPIWAMTKCFQNEQPAAVSKCIDLDHSDKLSQEHLMEAFTELFTEPDEVFVSYRENQRHVPRFIPWKAPNSALTFPKSEKFHLVLAPSNAISDLKFGASPRIPLKDYEVEVRVKAYALNFRDVFTVLKPIPEFENFNTCGIDWSGVVTAVGSKVTKRKVGDAVLGTNLNGGPMPSHLNLPETLLIPIPDHMSFFEAATLPVVAATAYLCLVNIAKLKKEDTILIHTASGGVGLLAIQIAQNIGATIVATAGSYRKRAYLKNLGIKYIFHSRNTNYEKDIRQALGGKGVDVVLNSLTSAGFKEASLAVCNEGARFVEMSKLNVWSEEEVKALRPDVKYDIIDLSAAPEEEMITHMGSIQGLMTENIINPIPFVRFDASEIRDALTYLQKAKHIGKIVCALPDPDLVNSGSSGPSQGIPMFSDRSTYLITGGLGGIGMEVAKWMCQSGAKNIVLVGRSAPNEKVLDEIRRLNSKGKNVLTLQYDVGHYEQCKEMLETIKSNGLPPLRGIMHAAGVLSDAIYSNQTWEKYGTTYHPKVKGGWNLHTLTLDLPLEHFVMFSSAVSNMGSMGQSNHASANFFLDSLAHYRNSLGLQATTVNWGQWGQVGVAANMEIVGLKPFSALQGISALERILKSQKPQMCVCDADFSIIKQVFSGTRKYIDELKLKQAQEVKELVINNEQFWNDYDAATDDPARLEIVKRFVRSMIRQILKLSSDDPLNDDENFQDLGMDSLMMIEMKNLVQSTLGKRVTITVNSVKDCHTVNQLSARLVELLSGEEEVPPPTREELIKMIEEDSTLPENIQPVPNAPACLPSEIKTILITGTTGNLGPYIVRDISRRSQITKIYCLIREDKAVEPNKRLAKVMTKKNLIDQVEMSKIECITGTVTKPRLGLSEEKYAELASNLDAIVHLAVKSNFTDMYKKIDRENSTDIRSINYKGTLRILELATTTKTKLLFHASTIAANAKVGKDFSLAESWPEPGEMDEMPNTAYPISKYITDRLMSQGVERGLPIKAFRFPAVGGDSITGGNLSYENNQLMLRMMSYLHLGMMPALPLPFFILPVDICSDLSLRVFFDDKTNFELYNVYNPYPHNETELVLIGEEMGYRMEILEPEDFQERLKQKEDSKLIHFLKEAAENKDAQDRFLKDSPAILQAWARNPEKAFVSKKLSNIIPEYPKGIENTLSVIKRDLIYAKNSGVFAKFGI